MPPPARSSDCMHYLLAAAACAIHSSVDLDAPAMHAVTLKPPHITAVPAPSASCVRVTAVWALLSLVLWWSNQLRPGSWVVKLLVRGGAT